MSKACFWFHDGACVLLTTPEDWVYDILVRNPKSREDLLSCSMDVCDGAKPEWISFAENLVVRDSTEAHDLWQKNINSYQDNHRKVSQGQVFRDPKKKKE